MADIAGDQVGGAKVKPKQPKFVRWAVMLGIVIILNIFFVVIRGILFSEPQYTDFCPANQPVPTDQSSCITAGGNWIPNPGPTSLAGASANQYAAMIPAGSCDMTAKCQTPFDAAQKSYEAKSFVLMVGLGVLALIVGILPLGSSIVSAGLSYGGVLAFVIGSISYWSDATQLIQLGISAIALAALIYIGLKRFRD